MLLIRKTKQYIKKQVQIKKDEKTNESLNITEADKWASCQLLIIKFFKIQSEWMMPHFILHFSVKINQNDAKQHHSQVFTLR